MALRGAAGLVHTAATMLFALPVLLDLCLPINTCVGSDVWIQDLRQSDGWVLHQPHYFSLLQFSSSCYMKRKSPLLQRHKQPTELAAGTIAQVSWSSQPVQQISMWKTYHLQFCFVALLPVPYCFCWWWERALWSQGKFSCLGIPVGCCVFLASDTVGYLGHTFSKKKLQKCKIIIFKLTEFC